MRLVAGVAAGAAVVWLPFLAAAPGPMLRMVVADQLGRPRMGVTNGDRLRGILNLTPHLAHVPPGGKRVVLAVALLVVLAAAVAAWTRRRARVVVLLLAATTVVVLAGPSYFRHYSSFPRRSSPWSSASRSRSCWRGPRERPRPRGRRPCWWWSRSRR